MQTIDLCNPKIFLSNRTSMFPKPTSLSTLILPLATACSNNADLMRRLKSTAGVSKYVKQSSPVGA